jgi:hypothetical protein
LGGSRRCEPVGQVKFLSVVSLQRTTTTLDIKNDADFAEYEGLVPARRGTPNVG